MEEDIKKIRNTLASLNLTSYDIERQIAGMKLSFLKEKDYKMEWGTMPPMFIPPFYNFVLLFNHIPSQEEYWNYYCEVSENEFTEYLRQNLNLLKARAYRAYPSFIRDIHFYRLLYESDQFEEVIYNVDLDINEGINFIIKYKSKLYCLNCYINTKRSYEGRDRKQFRHEKPTFCYIINLPVSFRGSKRCGDYFLYSKRELNTLLEQLKSLYNE
jgi:hypothetical protein